MKKNLVAATAAAALALTVAGGIAGGLTALTASDNTPSVTGVSVQDADTMVLAKAVTSRTSPGKITR